MVCGAIDVVEALLFCRLGGDKRRLNNNVNVLLVSLHNSNPNKGSSDIRNCCHVKNNLGCISSKEAENLASNKVFGFKTVQWIFLCDQNVKWDIRTSSEMVLYRCYTGLQTTAYFVTPRENFQRITLVEVV